MAQPEPSPPLIPPSETTRSGLGSGFWTPTGHGDAILGLAAAQADIIERVTFIRDRAGARFGELELNILTQVTSIGGDAETTLERLASTLGVEAELVRDSP